MALVSDIITEAFLDLGVIAAGQTITTEEQTDAFLRLNQMLANWSAEHISVFTETHQSFTLTAGTDAYTLGTAGTLTTSAYPVKITGASAVSGGFRAPVRILSFEEFHGEIDDSRGTTSILASVIARDNAFPSINLKVWPKPATSPGNLELDYWTQIAAFVTVGDTVSLPPGFEHAIHYNLAVALYPQYARQSGPDPVLIQNADRSKQAIMAVNQTILGMAAEPLGVTAPAAPAAPAKGNQ